MSVIEFEVKGNFSKLDSFLHKALSLGKFSFLDKYGERGVEALRANTPVDTGNTADKWYYEVRYGEGYAELVFSNSNIQNGFPVAIMLQYGHGTGTGGWVQGRDYIGPALIPIFEEIAEEAWKEVRMLRG